ncbi:hypothetical protein [Streptomyces sp. 8L]|uniref:hypothetical protein n=1 Tax=Streptomyces sp. 8L TaxID=2877242 RepID=UPI001CD1BAA9|nr:hypothetical protein [Streptomyces sp. 8L]MCA1218571.1 hypothetical protein [Streptomyces sp. 8L]
MNDGSSVTYNSAGYGSTVGVQAGVVHSVNLVHPDADPQEKYKAGVRSLEEGAPSRARELINDAIAHGYDSAEVRFHWVLATLSGRAYHDLDTEELQRLRHASARVPDYAEGEWKDALRVAFELLATLSAADGESGRVLDRLRDLSPLRRDAIVQHFDLVLTGGLKDSLWTENRERAEHERFGNDRAQRVWAYFEPEPIGPRAMPPRPSAAAAARAALPVRVGVFVVVTAFLFVLALVASPGASVVELLVALGAGLVAARYGRPWWYQEHHTKADTGESALPRPHDPASAGDGFTNGVRHSFDHYFSIRTPYGITPDAWLRHTAQIRNALGSEIAVLYRESRISVDRVNWLIRHLAEDVRDRHNKGALYARPDDQAPAAKGICVAALAALGITTVALLVTVASGSGAAQAVLAVLAAGGAVWSGRAAASRWLEAAGEERRVTEETREYEEQLATRQAAYQNWKSFLDAARPSELEMETWLTCDKTLFVDAALRHYQLTWRDLITHSILVTPARPYTRGRVKGGPWRYSRYSFRLFLVTQEGVREISTEFDFADAKRGNEQRSNYRFDALSSVQVTERTHVAYDLELVLTNGPARNIRVKDAETHYLTPDESEREVSEISLDSAGFVHTFRLLEGIAADGKGWIERNNPQNMPPFHTAD